LKSIDRKPTEWKISGWASLYFDISSTAERSQCAAKHPLQSIRA
jgi:hypothetical protein